MIRATFINTLFVVLASLVSRESSASPPETHRYPFDPACAWGRIADGRGLILRCLTKDEAQRLMKSLAPASTGGRGVGVAGQGTDTAAAQGTSQSSASSGAPAAAPPAAGTSPTGTVAPPGSAGGSGAAPTATGTAVSQPERSPSVQTTDSFVAELVGVVADDGELPLAKKKLALPLDRYAKCVADHGGLTATTGQVEVRFLVRERGRAEGAEVSRFRGLSEPAATCIAQVVDRRPTGIPAAPVVGAAATIRIRKLPAK